MPAWSDQFSLSDFDSFIFDLAVHDDGSGPTVYAAGLFTQAGNTPVNFLARLEGSDWGPVGDQFDELPRSLASCDDWPGLGPQLFAGGGFRHVGDVEASSIARWDGTSWTPMGTGVSISGKPYSWVFTMVFVPDGFDDGPALFAGGFFDTAGATPAMNVARWDGKGWSALGSGLDTSVDALAWFDDGGGPALYAAGAFTIGGQSADVARFNGRAWTPLATGLELYGNALVVHDDGRGPALFVAGTMPVAEADNLGAVARWDGLAWTQVGDTFDSPISELGVFDVGGGPVLGASGPFEHVGQTLVAHIAAWDGASWTPLGTGISATANGMVSIPGETAMYAGGFLQRAGGMVIGRFARWDGSMWSAVGNGAVGNYAGSGSGNVRALEVFDDGSGPGLYVGGNFVSAGGVAAASIVRWDGASGTPVGGGTDGGVVAMEVVTDPAIGPGLYVGGLFDQAGQTAAASIARWDGTTWSALAGGVSGVVRAMRVFDDGTGPALFVGGDFSEAGGVVTENIARWDGQQWAAVGQGLRGEDSNRDVYTLSVFDDGSGTGPALYAGGTFGHPASVPMGLARLEGDQWQPVGDGITGYVLSMTVFDDGAGAGPALFLGGEYCILPDDDTTCDLARWNGSTWSNIPMPGSTVYALGVYDDGTGFGPRLYAGGVLQNFADPALHHVGAWDGKTWTPLASGVGEPNSAATGVLAMAVFDDGLGDGKALYMGGVFETAGDLVSHNIARWGGCSLFVLGDLTGDGVVDSDDLDSLIETWGPCPEPCSPCPADLDGDCNVGITDFLILLANWTP
ncbi:MAG: hypothetical protein IID28_02895 [Planctomycetes bacterium]|nr:hypothetical protein [Planctomycetota bacterium]